MGTIVLKEIAQDDEEIEGGDTLRGFPFLGPEIVLEIIDSYNKEDLRVQLERDQIVELRDWLTQVLENYGD